MLAIYRDLIEDALTLARTHDNDIWVVESGTRWPTSAVDSRLRTA